MNFKVCGMAGKKINNNLVKYKYKSFEWCSSTLNEKSESKLTKNSKEVTWYMIIGLQTGKKMALQIVISW